jgi:hypothetical protein
MSSVITTTTTTAIEKQQERLSTFAAAWQAVDQAIHHRLSPPKLLHAPEAGGPTVLAMCLAPIPIATDKLCDEPSPEQIASGKKRCARLSFVVLKVMSPGWSFVDGEPVSTRGPAAKKGDKARFEKDKLSHLATANGVNHALMHCFEVGAKVGAIYHRGARTRECFLVSPGMVFTLKVWDDKIPKVFSGHGHANVFPFDIAFLELTAKSTNCKVQDNQLDVRRFSAVHGVSPASRVLFPSNLATTSMLHHAIVQAHHISGTHFGMTQAALDGLRHSSNPAEAKVVVDTNHNNNNNEEDGPPLPPSKEETLAVAIVPVLPENLTQDWIKSSLSPTISLIRVVPQTGTFAVGPDSVLRFHSEGGLLDLPCGTLLVQYDARQYPTATAATVAVAEIKNDDQVVDGDKKTAATTMMIARGDAVSHDPWLIKLFNVAVVAGAVELLVTVDTYRGKDDGSGGGEVSLPAFARIDVSVLVAILLRATQHSLAVPLPEAVTTTFDVQVGRCCFCCFCCFCCWCLRCVCVHYYHYYRACVTPYRIWWRFRYPPPLATTWWWTSANSSVAPLLPPPPPPPTTTLPRLFSLRWSPTPPPGSAATTCTCSSKAVSSSTSSPPFTFRASRP